MNYKEKALQELRQARHLLLNVAATVHCDWPNNSTPDTVNEFDAVNANLQLLSKQERDYATI